MQTFSTALNGAAILAELISKASPAVALAEHIRILNEKYTRREIINSAAKATALAFDEGTDGSEIAAKEVFLADIYRLKREERSMRTATTLADTLNHEVWPSIIERDKKHTHILGVRTGFPSVDDALGGLRGGTVTILGARPSTGKTALSLNMWRFTKSNGITEGFHRKMKLIQRRAYGYRNFQNYRLRVLIECGHIVI